jgi:3-deoxy-manno-octulosonate cytidylyltransferase (CMP-KDO synthetase)
VSRARVLGVIPARLGAQRLPGKPLRILGGLPLVERVARNAQRSGVLDLVVVATDAEEVAAAARKAGFKVAMTRGDHVSGTSRVAEVAALLEHAGYDIVVNVQGDEPFLPPAALAGSVEQVLKGHDIGTAAVPVDASKADSPALVKVVLDEQGRALYFSRSLIPHDRDGGTVTSYLQHLGVYAFRPDALQRMVRLVPTAAENAEKLEQLRALGHGMSIGVAVLREGALPGIDTADDLANAEAYLATQGEPFTA